MFPKAISRCKHYDVERFGTERRRLGENIQTSPADPSVPVKLGNETTDFCLARDVIMCRFSVDHSFRHSVSQTNNALIVFNTAD